MRDEKKRVPSGTIHSSPKGGDMVDCILLLWISSSLSLTKTMRPIFVGIMALVYDINNLRIKE